MDIEAVIESIWQHTLRRSYFPAEWKGRLTIEQAYRVQLGLLDRWVARGERLAGWKVGLTAPVIQRQFGMHEPVMGFLLESGHRDSGVRRSGMRELIEPGFENELCLTVGVRLEGPERHAAPRRGPRSRRSSPRSRSSRAAAISGRTCPLALTDNSQQKAFVTGPASPLPAGWEPAQHDGGGAHQRPAGRPRRRAARRPATRSGRSPGSPRSSRSSVAGSSRAIGSCRARSRSSTRSRGGTGSRRGSPRSGPSRRRSTDPAAAPRAGLARPRSPRLVCRPRSGRRRTRVETCCN